jgi:predicted glycosyltransferase
MTKGSRGPRIALYTHDTFGLGHVRRALNIAHAVADKDPDAAILIVTGCPALGFMQTLPQNADFVKIPTLGSYAVTASQHADLDRISTTAKIGERGCQPPHLAINHAEIIEIRKRLLHQTLVGFRPDVLLIDNYPLGMGRELLPTIQELSAGSTRIVLGLRDIVDAPEKVRENWTRDGIYEILGTYYDDIFVYGMPEIFDAIDAYGLQPHLASMVRYCGYVTDAAAATRPPSKFADELDIENPFVLACVGGGGDGFPVLETFARAFKLLSGVSGVSGVIATGPMMGRREKERLAELVAGQPRLMLKEFVADLPGLLARADAVVSMGGYNTSLEIIRAHVPAVIVPRQWRHAVDSKQSNIGDEWEQLIRARFLEDLGLAQVIELQDLNPCRT